MNVVCFTYRGKFGHFLRAEANANGITYPVPPRTALLGLLGAILGLSKDTPQEILAEARLAVGGEVPQRFWHKTNVRKDPPARLAHLIRVGQGTRPTAPEKNFRFPQEWLWQPCYRVWASLPPSHHADLCSRLREGRCHFTPCLGLSEMLAELEPVGECEADPLAPGTHLVHSLARHEAGRVDTAAACADDLAVQSLRMPWAVTSERVFSHRTYLMEHRGRPFPFDTGEAWRCGSETVVWL
jgi:CRISPR-associated protein Cas5h